MRLKPFKTASRTSSPARSAYICTWDPTEARSWRTNMAQDAIEGLYLTSRFAE